MAYLTSPIPDNQQPANDNLPQTNETSQTQSAPTLEPSTEPALQSTLDSASQ